MFFFQKTGEGGGVQKLDNVYTVGPDIRTPDNASAYADLIWVQIILYVILFHLSRIPRSVSGRSVLPQNTVLLSILLHLTERKNSMISRLIQYPHSTWLWVFLHVRLSGVIAFLNILLLQINNVLIK